MAPDALRLVARYAAGSLRDAENLLEQLVVSYGDDVTMAQAEELLGLGHSERWLDLVKYLLTGNTSASLEVINQAAWEGADLRQLHRQAMELLRAAMLLEWGAAEALELPEHVTAQLKELVGNLPNWRVVKALRLWGEVNMRYDAPSTLPLELAVVEICNDEIAPPPHLAAPAAAAPAPASRRSTAPPDAARSPAVMPAAAGAERPRLAPARPASGGEPVMADRTGGYGGGPAGVPGGGSELSASWLATVKALNRCKGRKYNLGALLRDCKADTITLESDTLIMPFVHRPNMERMQEEMDDPNSRQMVKDAVAQYFGSPYEFKITLAGELEEGGSAARSPQHSPLVRTAMNMGARILEDTVE